MSMKVTFFCLLTSSEIDICEGLGYNESTLLSFLRVSELEQLRVALGIPSMSVFFKVLEQRAAAKDYIFI